MDMPFDIDLLACVRIIGYGNLILDVELKGVSDVQIKYMYTSFSN